MYVKTAADIDRCVDEGRCINCGELFSEHNVFTEAGARETHISGMCEKCFDEVTCEIDDEYND
jgi:hypothetical protein